MTLRFLFNTDIVSVPQICKGFKMGKTKEKRLTLDEVATEIKGLFTTSAMANIRVG
jgi:hypothetical protein